MAGTLLTYLYHFIGFRWNSLEHFPIVYVRTLKMSATMEERVPYCCSFITKRLQHDDTLKDGISILTADPGRTMPKPMFNLKCVRVLP